jgi:integrase/recombinase XerD
MKTTHSFAIDFIIRRCKDDKKQALIYARITIDEERKEISLKERINATDWDTEREVVKGRTEPVKSLNQHIEDVRFKIKEKYRVLCDKECLVTAETVKQAYLGTHTLLKGHKLNELLDYYYKIWEPKLKPGGFKNVKTTIERSANLAFCPGGRDSAAGCTCRVGSGSGLRQPPSITTL